MDRGPRNYGEESEATRDFGGCRAHGKRCNPPAKTVAVLQTAGFAALTPGAGKAFADFQGKLQGTGIHLLTRDGAKIVADVEAAIVGAGSLSRAINAWEFRWPLNTYARDIDRSGLSQAMRTRLSDAEAMTLEGYQQLLTERARCRAIYAGLAASVTHASHCQRLGLRRWDWHRPAIRHSRYLQASWVFPPSRCHCSKWRACRWAFRYWALASVTLICLRSPCPLRNPKRRAWINNGMHSIPSIESHRLGSSLACDHRGTKQELASPLRIFCNPTELVEIFFPYFGITLLKPLLILDRLLLNKFYGHGTTLEAVEIKRAIGVPCRVEHRSACPPD